MVLTDDNLEFPDLLGSAYEYLIKYFADSAGKKGGEFYTPRTVVKLLVTILDPAQDAEICDPTVGSGGMLIESFNSVESKYGSARKLTLYGQEKNGTTWGLCKLNMLFHDILDAQIENGDTLNEPKHREGKVQNTLRSEDIEKIAYVYRNRWYLRSSLENLWEKYHQPLHSILKRKFQQ